MSKDLKTHLFYWAITLLSLFFCAVIGSHNRDLTQKLREGAGGGGLSGSHEAITGDILPGFESREGATVRIAYEQSPFPSDTDIPYRLLLVHSPNCGVCRIQAGVWQELVDDVSQRAPLIEAKAILLPGESESEPLLEGLQTLTFPDFSFQRAYRVTGIPLTLLVSPQGRLLWSHYGLLEAPKARALMQLIEDELKNSSDDTEL